MNILNSVAVCSPANRQLSALCSLLLLLSGCSHLNSYARGFDSGMKDYDLTRRGHLPKPYIVGWIEGYSLMKAADDLKGSMKVLENSLRELNDHPLKEFDDGIQKIINENLDKTK